MITKISQIRDIKDFKQIIFLYGNFDFYKNSFINFLCKMFSKDYEISYIKTVEEINTNYRSGLFGDIKSKLYIMSVTDKIAEHLHNKIDFQNTRDRFIFVDNDFKKTKKISIEFQKSKDVQSIAFFENNSKDYINFLFNFFKTQVNVDFFALNTELIARKEDPFKFFEKITLLNTEDLIEYLNYSHINKSAIDMEPISLIRFCLASLKFSSDLKLLPHIKNNKANKDEISFKLMNLEAFYKSKNVKSKIFISKEFL